MDWLARPNVLGMSEPLVHFTSEMYKRAVMLEVIVERVLFKSCSGDERLTLVLGS